MPRFDIPAQRGPLALGTVISDLEHLTPLNIRNRIQVPENLVYNPVVQTNVQDTLLKARTSNFKAWLQARGLPVEGSVSVGGSKEVENDMSCESIVATYFDPDHAYVKDCLAVKPIQDWLDNTNSSANLYLVTGLKVAKKLKFNNSSTAEHRVKGEIQVSEPYTNVVDAGAGIDVSGTDQKKLGFEVDDIVIGTRFYRVKCVKRFFHKAWDIKPIGVFDGDMRGHRADMMSYREGMTSDGKEAVEQPDGIDFEPLPILEETIAREHAAIAGEDECWIS